MAKQASVLEENQYLSKMQDQLGENSRENKVIEGEEKVAAAKAKFCRRRGQRRLPPPPSGSSPPRSGWRR